jgi:hypothetical protein
MSRRGRPDTRLWLAAFALVALATQLAVGMRASNGAEITGDEPFYLLTTQSLRSDGDLDLTDEYATEEYREFWDADIPLWRQMEPAEDGRLLSPHEPGLSILVLPAYVLDGVTGVQRFLALLWAAAMATAALVAVRLGAPRWASGLAAVAVGAGAPGIVYASQIYPEGPAALAVAVALFVCVGERPRPVAMAAALLALPWLGNKYVLVALVLASAWAWRFRAHRGALAAVSAVGALAGAHYAWWHLQTFDGLTPYGVNVVWAGEHTSEVLNDHFRLRDRGFRLYALWLDERFGLLRWSPVAVLAAWGVRRSAGLAGAVFASGMAIGSFASITIMGWWFPGRMLVAGFPGLVVAVAFGAARLRRTAKVLAAWSLAIGAAVAWSAHHGGIRLAVDPWTVGAPLPWAWAFPDFRSFGTAQVLASVVWATVVAWALHRTAPVVATVPRTEPHGDDDGGEGSSPSERPPPLAAGAATRR